MNVAWSTCARTQCLLNILPHLVRAVWIDRFKAKSFLKCKVPGTNRVLTGTAQVALCTAAAVENESEQSGIRIVVEVKKPGDTGGGCVLQVEISFVRLVQLLRSPSCGFAHRKLPQLAAELLGANYSSTHFKPFGILTDLVST